MICLCPKAHFLIISNNSQFAQPINERFFLMSKTSCLWKTRILSPKACVCIVWDIIYLPVMVSSSDFFKVSFVFITLRNKHFKKKSLSSFSLFKITFFLKSRSCLHTSSYDHQFKRLWLLNHLCLFLKLWKLSYVFAYSIWDDLYYWLQALIASRLENVCINDALYDPSDIRSGVI